MSLSVNSGELATTRQIAQVYADAGFHNAFSPEAIEVLATVEPIEIDAESCSPALESLQKRGSTSGPVTP